MLHVRLRNLSYTMDKKQQKWQNGVCVYVCACAYTHVHGAGKERTLNAMFNWSVPYLICLMDLYWKTFFCCLKSTDDKWKSTFIPKSCSKDLKHAGSRHFAKANYIPYSLLRAISWETFVSTLLEVINTPTLKFPCKLRHL